MATIRATEDKPIATTAYESKLDIVDSEVAKVRDKHCSDLDAPLFQHVYRGHVLHLQ